jgi:hypothetical protein
MPRLEQLLEVEEVIPTGGEQQPVGALLASIQEAIASYHQLLNDWAGLGLQDGLSRSALLEAPLVRKTSGRSDPLKDPRVLC